MTEPIDAAEPIPVKEAVGAFVPPDMPDEEKMTTEIQDDRKHERFLVRAALIAAVGVAMVILVRLWG